MSEFNETLGRIGQGRHSRRGVLKQAAIAGGDPSETSISVNQSVAPTRANGNNVNLDFELLAERENVLRQKLVVQAVNAKYALLRTALGQ